MYLCNVGQTVISQIIQYYHTAKKNFSYRDSGVTTHTHKFSYCETNFVNMSCLLVNVTQELTKIMRYSALGHYGEWTANKKMIILYPTQSLHIL